MFWRVADNDWTCYYVIWPTWSRNFPLNFHQMKSTGPVSQLSFWLRPKRLENSQEMAQTCRNQGAQKRILILDSTNLNIVIMYFSWIILNILKYFEYGFVEVSPNFTLIGCNWSQKEMLLIVRVTQNTSSGADVWNFVSLTRHSWYSELEACKAAPSINCKRNGHPVFEIWWIHRLPWYAQRR